MVADVTWDLPNILRAASSLLLLVCVSEILGFLWVYWRKIVPMRQRIAEGRVLAPPVYWTFGYHLLVAGIFLNSAVARIQILAGPHADTVPATLSTYTTPVLAGLLIVVLRKFHHYYYRTLRLEDLRENP